MAGYNTGARQEVPSNDSARQRTACLALTRVGETRLASNSKDAAKRVHTPTLFHRQGTG